MPSWATRRPHPQPTVLDLLQQLDIAKVGLATEAVP
jgi:hypothetical protein